MKVTNQKHINTPANNSFLTNSQISEMINMINKTGKMNIFEKPWAALRHLFRSDKHSQSAARQILKDAIYLQNCGDYSEYFTGAVDRNASNKLIHWLAKFNKIKELAINPEQIVAEGEISSEGTLSVRFFIGDTLIHIQDLQLEKSTRTGGINLSHAYLSGVSLCGAYLCKADLSNAEMDNICLFGTDLRGANLNNADLYRADLRNTNLDGANLNNANLRKTHVDTNTNIFPADAIID